ncbi:hypothetical protein BCD64_13345 [Nostoc sp. MBR 210]|nr:hypothetical protein BCD64_13345 [Nostoc sp. MBR 210]
MNYLPPTPLIIEYRTWRVLDKSLNGGNLRSVFTGIKVSLQKFYLLGYLLKLSLPRKIGEYIRKQISIYELLIIG